MEHFYVVNGKAFSNLEEAEKYENEIKELEEKANKLKAEEDARLKEIRDAENKLSELYDKFVEDYGYVNIDLEIPKCCFDW